MGKAAREAAGKDNSVRQLPGPKLFVGPSQIHGKGLFADEFIEAILFIFNSLRLSIIPFFHYRSIFIRLTTLFVNMLANCLSQNLLMRDKQFTHVVVFIVIFSRLTRIKPSTEHCWETTIVSQTIRARFS